MKRLLSALCILAFASGTVMAAAHITQMPEGMNSAPYQQPSRDSICQYGFQDDGVGWGYTLGFGQALGISCGSGTITGVGAYCEFIAQPGTCDVVIYDNGVEVQRTPVVPVAGNNEWDVPDVAVSGTSCIMLTPEDPFWAVTGEDQNSPPYGNSYFGSYNVSCPNPFGAVNLTIWAHFGGGTPTQDTSWGRIRAMYR